MKLIFHSETEWRPTEGPRESMGYWIRHLPIRSCAHHRSRNRIERTGNQKKYPKNINQNIWSHWFFSTHYALADNTLPEALGGRNSLGCRTATRDIKNMDISYDRVERVHQLKNPSVDRLLKKSHTTQRDSCCLWRIKSCIRNRSLRKTPNQKRQYSHPFSC